jgi:hypothetical protein
VILTRRFPEIRSVLYGGLILAYSFQSPALAQSQEENPCTLKVDKDSVMVYTCENKDSKFRMVKTVFEVDTTPEHIASVLFDIAGYNNWQYKTINAGVLQQISDTELIYYAEFVSPWPFSNRDVIVHMKIEHTGPMLKVTYRGIPDFIPEKDGVTRVASSASTLDVVTLSAPTPAGKTGRIRVEYKSNVDPGGNLPAFLMNQFADAGPFESFSALRKLLNLEAEKILADKK